MRKCKKCGQLLHVIEQVAALNRNLNNRTRPQEWNCIVRYKCSKCGHINDFEVPYLELLPEEKEKLNGK